MLNCSFYWHQVIHQQSKGYANKMTQDHSIRRPRVGVGIGVINDGKVLLGKRKGAHGAGKWSFVGGHLEFRETVEECAKRELAEETGLNALSFQLGPWTNDVIEETKHYLTIFVFVNQFDGTLSLKEPHKCEGWEWFEWDAMPSPLFTPVRSLIKKMGIEQLKYLFSSKNSDILTRN